MTQEDKDLLLKDLCARLPYGVRCQISRVIGTTSICDLLTSATIRYIMDEVWEAKPYLRPMSSMTKEEETEYAFLLNDGGWGVSERLIIECLDWLNKHHFDYRGLIEKGLAIEVTDDNNPYK